MNVDKITKLGNSDVLKILTKSWSTFRVCTNGLKDVVSILPKLSTQKHVVYANIA